MHTAHLFSPRYCNLQGVPQNSLHFLFWNFSALNAPIMLIFDIFKQHISSAVENCQKFYKSRNIWPNNKGNTIRDTKEKSTTLYRIQEFVSMLKFHNLHHLYELQHKLFIYFWHFINSINLFFCQTVFSM